MDKINWANYNSDEFELFCNALISFEFGKGYKPFSAPGRDGGIDGAFSGAYEGRSGEWRFQFKFYLTSRNEAVSNLKFQIKKEATKLNSESHFVLMTNVELLPQEANSIKDVFDEQLKASNKSCLFWLWDGAKLYNLYIQYPILSLWLQDGFSTAQLRPYRDVYKFNLDAEDFSPSSMSTFFLGRNKDLEDLTDFLSSSRQMAVISGEAGIGKTRLTLEFFERQMSQLSDWTILVLANRNFNYDTFYRALFPGRNYIVFIDDAHTFDPKIIADINAITHQLNNVKLILTVRNIQASVALSLVKEYDSNQQLRINLTELSRPDTEQIFLRYLNQGDFKLFINQLVAISFGKPIMIVAMLNAIKQGVQINRIKEQNFLRDYVANYFDSYIDKVHVETGIVRVDIRRLLQTVALLEPFNFNDSDNVGKIASLLCLDQHKVNTALKYLIDFAYVNGRYEQSIKPDFYSDILLSDIDPEEVVHFLTGFVTLIGNIIINLSSVDEVNRDNSHILNAILQIYINVIETSADIAVIKRILTTVSTITFVKQDIAKKTIDIYLNCLASADHPIRIEYEEDKRSKYHSASSAVSIIITVLDHLYDFAENADFVYRRSIKLYSLIEEKNIVTIFAFDKRDALQKFTMKRQDFFLGEFSRNFKKFNAVEQTFGLQCLKAFAALDFTLTEWSTVNRDTLITTTYFLPTSSNVKKFRKRLIELLIELYRSDGTKIDHGDLLTAIIDIPRAIFATSRNSKPYQNDIEIQSSLQFLKEETATFNLVEQKEILQRLYWFVKWGISQDLIPLINEVQDALKPKNLVERLSHLFSKVETNVLEIKNIQEYIEQKAIEIVQAENPEILADAIVIFLSQQPSPPHYYWTFQGILERQFPEYAKILHQKLYLQPMQIYEMCAPGILGTLYFGHHDEIFFWDQVHVLQKLDSVAADNIILSVYAQRVPAWQLAKENDTEAIILIFNKSRKENNYHMAMALQLLFAANHVDAMSLCQKFLDRVDQRQAEMFFIRLSDNKTVSRDQISDLVLNHTVRFDLTYALEMCLNLMLDTKGEDAIFEYLVKRFNYKKQEVISTRSLRGYEFLPDGDHSQLYSGYIGKKLPLFTKAVNWYVNLDDDPGHLYYAKDIITYLQPGQGISQDLFEMYSIMLRNNSDDPVRLARVIDTLAEFQIKDENSLQLIIDIFPVVNDYQDTDPEHYKRLLYECYTALTTMGVKTGTPGMPFQVDVDLMELLETFITRLDELSPARNFLNDVLKGVESEIDRGRDRENLTW